MLPEIISAGFHREDYAPSDPHSLAAGRPPEVGQRVKVQISFSEPLQTRYEGEPSTWCAMGGEVDEIVAADRIRVRMSATSDHTPIGFDEEEFEAVLVRDEDHEHPWLLHSLFQVTRACPLPPTPAPLDGENEARLIRVCTVGSDAADYLAALTARLDRLAYAMLPGDAEIPRRQRLAHGIELALRTTRGLPTSALFYEPTAELFDAWLRLADAVLVVGSSNAAIDTALAACEVRVTRALLDPAQVIVIAKAAVQPAPLRASTA